MLIIQWNQQLVIHYTCGFGFVEIHPLLLDTTKAGVNTSIIVSVTPNIEINSGVAVTVGAGKTMIIDVLQIGDL